MGRPRKIKFREMVLIGITEDGTEFLISNKDDLFVEAEFLAIRTYKLMNIKPNETTTIPK